MNDEFLYALRRKPPRAFAQKLKQQLDRQVSKRALFPGRAWLMTLLMGASALAGTMLVIKRHDIIDREQHVSSSTSSAQAAASASKRLPEGRMSWSRDPSEGEGRSAVVGRTAVEAANAAQSRASDKERSEQETSQQGSSTLLGRVGGGGTVRGGSVAANVTVITSELALPFTKVVVGEATKGVAIKNAQVDLRTAEAEEAFRQLCSGGAYPRPVIAVTSRRITAEEMEYCRRADLFEVPEFKVGYHALVVTGLATSVPIKLSPAQIRAAVAQRVQEPSPPFRVIDNAYRSWDQIDPRLDPRGIEVLGPGRDQPLRRLFEMKVLKPGCQMLTRDGSMPVDDPERDSGACLALRDDGVYREIDQAQATVVQTLWSAPHAIAVVGYTFYRYRRDDFAGSMLTGVEPTNATLADGSYPLASPVYVYANDNALRSERGLFNRVYVNLTELAFDWNYLERGGITPIDEDERKAQRERQRALRTFSTNTKQ